MTVHLIRWHIPDNERAWWMRFATLVEGNQTLGLSMRSGLEDGLVAAANDASIWALSLCARIGLFDEAWSIQQTAALSPDDSLDHDHAMLGEYARWILGKGRRKPPTAVTAGDREYAFRLLGERAERDPEVRSVLVEAVKQSGRPDQVRAIDGIRWWEGHGVDELRTTVAALARERNAPARGFAFLRMVLGWRERTAVGCLCSVALDCHDALNGIAIELLCALSLSGDRQALQVLMAIATDHEHPSRTIAIVGISHMAKQGLTSVVDTLVAIAFDYADPTRPLAVWELWNLAAEGDPAAMHTISSIERDLDDPVRILLLCYLWWQSGWDQHGQEYEALVATARGSDQPLMQIAGGVLQLVRNGDVVDVPMHVMMSVHNAMSLRALSAWVLGRAAERGQTDALEHLIRSAGDRHDPMRAFVLWMLRLSVGKGYPVAISAVSRIARDDSDPARGMAFWLMQTAAEDSGGTADEGQAAALKALGDIAGDHSSSARWAAFMELACLARTGQPESRRRILELESLCSIVADLGDPMRGLLIRELGLHARALPGSTLDALSSVARNVEDPASTWAAEALSQASRERNPGANEPAFSASRQAPRVRPSTGSLPSGEQ